MDISHKRLRWGLLVTHANTNTVLGSYLCRNNIMKAHVTCHL